MTFDDFAFTIKNLSNRLLGSKKGLGFYVKLSDGKIIEFHTKAEYNWENLFIIQRETHLNPPKYYGFLSVSIWNEKENESNLYVVPCENIDYIHVVLKDDVDNKNHLISW